MASVTENAFVLKTVRYGEADLIVTCLTSRGAKLGLLARAALKSRKRFGGGVLEPTHFVQLTFDKKGNDEQRLFTLKEASLLDDFGKLRESYDRLNCAIRATQVIYTIAREEVEDQQQLFDLYGHGLRALTQASDPAAVWTLFLGKLLYQQGVLPMDPEYLPLLKSSLASWQDLTAQTRWSKLKPDFERKAQDYLGRVI